MRIIEGVYKADGVVANSYVVTGKKHAIIDCGMPHNASKIIKTVKEAGLSPKEISFILLTHAHVDHTGSAAKVKANTGAKIAIHEQDAGYLTGEKSFAFPRGIKGLLFRIASPFILSRVEPDMLLKDGDLVGGFEVIHIPGHTEGSCAYLHRSTKSLFIGDSISTEQDSLSLPPEIYNFDTQMLKKSLQKIRELEFDNLFPGHGEPIIGKASEKVKKFVERLA